MNSSKIDSATSLEELAYVVSQTLRNHGLDAILTGGAVVSIYTQNRYQSYDLDFISPASPQEVADAMRELGFERQGERHYVHPECKFGVEFPSSVNMIGDTHIPLSEYAELESNVGTLRLLTPTHATMDRLAAFYHWGDRASLLQATWIAAAQDVDLDVVEKWSRAEGTAQQYEVFEAALRRYIEGLGFAGNEDELEDRGPQQTR